jgi:hypothetical protein
MTDIQVCGLSLCVISLLWLLWKSLKPRSNHDAFMCEVNRVYQEKLHELDKTERALQEFEDES